MARVIVAFHGCIVINKIQQNNSPFDLDLKDEIAQTGTIYS